MDVNPNTLEQIYQDIVQSVGYKTTVGPVDKRKVEQRRLGSPTKLPSARLAKSAWRTAALLVPLVPPPPPPPPPPKVAPQTYNRGSAGQDARYCTAGLPHNGAGQPFDQFSAYDENGLSLGGRTGNPVPGLKPADQMDGRGACDPYGPFPPWPTSSYNQ